MKRWRSIVPAVVPIGVLSGCENANRGRTVKPPVERVVRLPRFRTSQCGPTVSSGRRKPAASAEHFQETGGRWSMCPEDLVS
jgi:hypothetical protein